MNNSIVRISHIVVTIILVGLVLIQNRSDNQGGFLSGGGETFKTRRGIEKIIFYATIVFAVLFVALTIWALKLS